MLDIHSRTPVLAAFTDRHGGVAPAPYDSFTLAAPADPVRGDGVTGDWSGIVAENHRILAEGLRSEALAAGAAPSLVLMRQVHGADVAVIDETSAPAAEPPTVDALVTTRRDVALVVRVADCVPVLLADAAAGVVAAVHAGRAGVAADVVGVTLDAMADLGGGSPQAWIGPSICGACYEVPVAMADDVAAVAPASRTTTRQGTLGLDLPAAVEARLRDRGVQQVVRSDRCTLEDADLFSHRRDAGASGRAAGVIWLLPESSS